MVILLLNMNAIHAQFLKTDFLSGYDIGSTIEIGEYIDSTTSSMLNQWNLSRSEKGGQNPLGVDTLTYEGYVNSKKSIAVSLLSTSPSRASVFSLASDDTSFGSGTYYLAFMLNVSKAITEQGAEFIAFDSDQRGGAFRARVGVKKAGDNTFHIGVNGTNTLVCITWGNIAYNLNETYLVVLKADFDEEGMGSCLLFVNPTSKTKESEATIQVSLMGLQYIRGISLRQRANFEAYIGGISFSDNWNDLFTSNQTSIENEILDDNDVVLRRYYDLNGIEIYSLVNVSVYIEKIMYEDGRTIIKKRVR